LETKESSKLCTECGKPVNTPNCRGGRGLCRKHYNDWDKKNPPDGKPCVQSGCPHIANALNAYCHVHKARLAKGASMDRPVRINGKWDVICRGPECDRDAFANGYCPSHNAQLYRGADIAPIKKSSIFDDCTYNMAHDRCTRLWGPAKGYPCVACDGQAKEWAYDGTDPGEVYGPNRGGRGISNIYYSAFPEFYMPMCHKCHRVRDLGRAFTELKVYREWTYRTGKTLDAAIAPDASKCEPMDPAVALATLGHSINLN
jgi:hypothetical protein